MKYDREARRCALQVMYQFDAGAVDDLDTVRETLDGSGASEAAREKGFALANLADSLELQNDVVREGGVEVLSKIGAHDDARVQRDVARFSQRD